MRIDVMGVGFDSLTMDEAVARARDLMAERRAAYVVTPNPEIVMLCREDPAAMQAVQGADLVLPDGIGVIYGAKILGTPLRAKLPGIDFAAALMTQMGREGKSVFLLGAKPGVADAAGEKLREAELPAFFDWLYDLEYGKMGLPRPDLVLYLDVDLPTSLKRMQHRQEKLNTKADIHEQDEAYLENCLRIGRLAAAHYGWTVVPFMKDGAERALEEKHEEIFSIIRSAL